MWSLGQEQVPCFPGPWKTRQTEKLRPLPSPPSPPVTLIGGDGPGAGLTGSRTPHRTPTRTRSPPTNMCTRTRVYTPRLYALVCILPHMHTCAHMHALRHGAPMHGAQFGTDPPPQNARLTFPCGHKYQSSTQSSPSGKRTSAPPSLRFRLEACSFLHFLSLTHPHCAVSLACTLSLPQAYARCTPTVTRPRADPAPFCPCPSPISFTFTPAHTVSPASLLCLPHAVLPGFSHAGLQHMRSQSSQDPAEGQGPGPLHACPPLSPRAALAQDQLPGLRHSPLPFSIAMKPSRGAGAAREGLSPLSPDPRVGTSQTRQLAFHRTCVPSARFQLALAETQTQNLDINGPKVEALCLKGWGTWRPGKVR